MYAAEMKGPSVTFAVSCKELKGEDKVCVQPFRIGEQKCLLLMVCDGHGGAQCAQYFTVQFFKELEPNLPKSIPNWQSAEEVSDYATEIRSAIVTGVMNTEKLWQEHGHYAGTTMTAAFITGPLLTIANVGDSQAMVDTGGPTQEVTHSHRIGENKKEQTRCKSAGLIVAPLGTHLQGPAKTGEVGVGPLRIWPGGLCVSRSIGDGDASPLICPMPHVRQMFVPLQGIRLIMASDGLWDLMDFDKAAKITRGCGTDSSAQALITAAANDRRMSDDVSVMVMDMLPEGTSWPEVILPYLKKEKKGLFSFGKKKAEEAAAAAAEVVVPPTLTYIADVDALEEYEWNADDGTLVMTPQALEEMKVRRDLTMHGNDMAGYLFQG